MILHVKRRHLIPKITTCEANCCLSYGHIISEQLALPFCKLFSLIILCLLEEYSSLNGHYDNNGLLQMSEVKNDPSWRIRVMY